MIRQHAYDPNTLSGAIKLRAWDLGLPLTKRALQPWQVSVIAKRLSMDEKQLHALAAKHEGWKL